MSFTAKYANFDLTTGANDGSSEANAWQSMSAMKSGASAGHHVYMKQQSLPWDFTADETIANAGTVTNPIWFEAYETTPGDKGFWQIGINANIATLEFTGAHVWVEGLVFEDFGGTVNLNRLNVSGEGAWLLRSRVLCKSSNVFTNAMLCEFEIARNSSKVVCGAANNTSMFRYNRVFHTSGTTYGYAVFMDNYNSSCVCDQNIFIGSAISGIAGLYCHRVSSGYGCFISRNRFYNFDDDAVFLNAPGTEARDLVVIADNVFEAITGVCVGQSATGDAWTQLMHNYHYDTGGLTDFGFESEVRSSTSLTASPFNAPASNDLSLNDSIGGGAVCRAAGIAIDEPIDWTTRTLKAVASGTSGTSGSPYSGFRGV